MGTNYLIVVIVLIIALILFLVYFQQTYGIDSTRPFIQSSTKSALYCTDCEFCDFTNCHPRSQGYWKNHTDEWPTNDCITNEFNSDDPPWTFVKPRSDESYSIGGGILTINVPQGDHDPFTSFVAPRYVRPIPSGFNQNNFEVSAKITSTMSQRFQIQGIAIEDDHLNYIRMEAFHDGTRTHLYSQVVNNGVPAALINITPFGSGNTPAPMWLKVQGLSGTYKLFYSLDGINFTQAGSGLTSSLTVQRVGLYAGNAQGVNSPPHTATFEYIRDNSCVSIGPNSMFFNSWKTWLEVLKIPPGGNAYYILAKQYIAIILNQLRGCNYDNWQSYIDEATDFFDTYTPQTAENLSKEERNHFLHIAEIFDKLIQCMFE